MTNLSPSSDTRPRFSADTVAIVVVNWNAWQMTLECLATLRASRGAQWHLYIVDNASSDDSCEHLTGLGEDVTLVRSDVNGGWTGGNNLGVERALADGCDDIFLLNNDALVEPDTLAKLRDYQRSYPGNCVVGPIHYDGSGQMLDFVGATVNAQTGMPEISVARGTDPSALSADYATSFVKGAALWARREHFERVGLFDPAFYLNYDDTDWCFRARAAGIELRMLKSARILHAGSGSIGGALSPLNIYFLARNELLFSQRHCTRTRRLRHLVAFLRHSSRIPSYRSRTRRALALLTGSHPTARAWRMGVRDYLRRRFGDCPPEIRAMNRLGRS